MPGNTHKPYPEEFKKKMVSLVREGRTTEQADRDQGKRADGLTTDEREELQTLRRENERLREEREILEKAAAWFAQETEKGSRGSSSS